MSYPRKWPVTFLISTLLRSYFPLDLYPPSWGHSPDCIFSRTTLWSSHSSSCWNLSAGLVWGRDLQSPILPPVHLSLLNPLLFSLNVLHPSSCPSQHLQPRPSLLTPDSLISSIFSFNNISQASTSCQAYALRVQFEPRPVHCCIIS